MADELRATGSPEETLDASTPSTLGTQGEVSIKKTGDRVLTEDELQSRRRDWVRAAITGCFLLMLLYVIVFACWEAQSWNNHWEQTKELLQILLSPLTGLLGSSVGFYFGSRDRLSNSNHP